MSRKELINQLSQHLEVQATYLGGPSFAYQVGDYTVNREGKIQDKEGQEWEMETLLGQTVQAGRENGAINAAGVLNAIAETEPIALAVEIPLEGYDGKSLINLLRMIYSKQHLIKKALELDIDLVDEGSIAASEQERMVASDNLKQALEGVRCPGIDFDCAKETITFKLGAVGDSPEKVQAATQLLALVNTYAKRQKKKVAARVKPTDNEKYTFRTWLLRLGMIGDEYKASRKLLLRNLSGNASFRKQGQVG
jgi:hypothetical protein